ncbi:MAG: SGNH/GDSL hydrolase family protein [bacterium]
MKQKNRTMSRAGVLFTVITYVVGALLWTEVILYSQNTLLLNGRWRSTKSRMGVIEASFLITRSPLSRNRLNLAKWHGFNEVIFKEALLPDVFRFRFKLKEKAYLNVIFNKTIKGFSGLRLSRNPGHGNAFFDSAADGRFMSMSTLEIASISGRWHELSLQFRDGRVTAWLDQKEIGSMRTGTTYEQLLGFRSGFYQAIVDEVHIRDRPGRIYHDSFRNTKNQARIFLAVSALALILFCCSLLIPAPHRLALSPAVVFSGLLFFCFDYCYWSKLELNAFFGPLIGTGRFDPAQAVESARYRIFENCNRLLTNRTITPRRQFFVQGDTDIQDNFGSFFCPMHINHNASKLKDAELKKLFSAEKKAYRILFIGTSQTKGVGARRLKDSFFVKTHESLMRRLRRPLESMNMAIAGANAEKLLDRYRNKFLSFKPDLVVINLASNDSAQTLRAGLQGFLTINKFRKIKTILVKEANSNERPDPTLVCKHEIMEDMARTFGVPVYDLHRFLNDPQVVNSGFLWWDHVHPTSFGHTLISEWLSPRIFNAIEEIR